MLELPTEIQYCSKTESLLIRSILFLNTHLMRMDHQRILLIGVETAETRKASTKIERRAGILAEKTEGLYKDYSKQKVIVQTAQQENATEKRG